MSEERLQELIKLAQTLSSDEQLRMAAHLEKMAREADSAIVARDRWTKIQAHRSEILNLAQQRGASNVRVFGVKETGNVQLGVEVDFIVNLESGRSLLDQGGLMADLQELLGFEELYVFTDKGIKERYREQILAEAIPLWEAT